MRNIDMNEAGDQSARETAERDRMLLRLLKGSIRISQRILGAAG